MRRWKCTLVTIIFVSTFVLAWWGEAGAVPFSFQINRFQVNQNGADIVNDGFDDGQEPPDGPNGSSTYLTIGTFGEFDESGSRLNLNNIGAQNINTFGSVSGMSVPAESKGAILRGPAGLIPKGDAWFVEAKFAGILPADTGPIFGLREEYRIGIRDFAILGNNNDFALLHVVNVGGDPQIQFIDIDPSTSTTAFLGSLTPLGPSFTPEITLRLDVDTSGVVTALYNGSLILDSGGVNPATTTIYNGENVAFALFGALSPVPEPSTLLLLGSGLAGLGFFRRRKKAA